MTKVLPAFEFAGSEYSGKLFTTRGESVKVTRNGSNDVRIEVSNGVSFQVHPGMNLEFEVR
jgi:hypothetical protein